MSRRFYVTTPIYYVNDVPHLGTAYTTVVCDALRRYHLLRGDDTFMLTGTDEHGLKIEREAKARGQSPKAFVDDISKKFRDAWPHLLIEPSHFIRTTDAEHMAFVQELWTKIEKNGDLYQGSYEDWYCVGCESFKTEKELLPGNVCPLHLKPVERLKEDTYFFRLEKWQKPLLDLYARRPDFVAPATRRNEVVSFVEGGLKDLSVSRTSFSWGIPVPGNPKHVMFVWFDALTNYKSALGYGDRTRFWPPKGRAVHVVGKDILRFHAVYWPAFLLAAGYTEDELPSQIFAHGFLTVDGQKMSKTLRNSVDPIRLAKELGPDVLRYHLLRAISFGQDGDFDHAALIEKYNADLGKNLGNLLNRTLGLCAKLTGGKTPAMGARSPLEDDLVGRTLSEASAAAAGWQALEPHRALEATWAIASAANQYIDRAAPWAAAKNGDMVRLETILAALLEVLKTLSVLVWPAIPDKANELRAQLGLPPLAPALDLDLWPETFEPRPAGEPLGTAVALFPVIDADREKDLLERLAPKLGAGVTEPSDKASPDVKAAATTAKASPAAEGVSYDTFAAVDLRLGVVKTAERIPKKDKLLRLTVDIGEPEPRTIVAGIAQSFQPDALIGRRVVVVANLAPRDFGKGLVSHGMLLAATGGVPESLHLATIDAPSDTGPAPGTRLK